MYFACREVYLAWLTGIRILAEGSVIDPYYGNGGYRYARGTKCRMIVLVVIHLSQYSMVRYNMHLYHYNNDRLVV